MLALALRANLRHCPSRAAVVTLQPLSGLRDRIVLAYLLVVRHRDRTVLALNLLAATSAHHYSRIPAAVQQQDHLLPAIERELRLLNQTPRKDLLLPGLAKLRAHIDQFYHRQRALHHALAQLHPRIAALLRIGPALERRRSRTQHHYCFL